MGNKGKTKCKAYKFNNATKEHYVKFYSESGKPIRVSVRNDVDKKHCWMLDLMELADEGLMDLDQFAEVNVDNQWMLEVQKAQKKAEKTDSVSPYWICGYCRAYVKHSKTSLKQLCKSL